MKGLIIGGGFLLGLVLGFWPGGVSRAKPLWWRILAVVSMLALVGLALGVPTGGSFDAAAKIGMTRGDTAVVPIRATVVALPNDSTDTYQMKDVLGMTNPVRVEGSDIDRSQLQLGHDVIMAMDFDHAAHAFVAHRLISVDPLMSLPLIPGLEERARNLYFHVPVAWISQLAWFVAFGFAVVYLRKRRPEDDIRAAAAAGLGALFCVLAAVTGSIWARFNWGVFWNWDPRQVSIFIVLVIYGAYFALRSAVDNPEQRARFSAIYLVLLALPVVYFMFIMPRLTGGLHPGSQGDVNIGPVLSPKEDALHPLKQVIFGLSGLSYTMLFFWMLNIGTRSQLFDLRRRRRQHASDVSASGTPAAMGPDVVRLS